MIGSQVPRIQVEPKRVCTDGEDAATLMDAYGDTLDPWQKTVVDCWLGKDENGGYSVTSAGLSVPRQNGKNVCLEARELYGMLINGEKILHTAHLLKTAKKSFQRLVRIFTDERHPEIVKEVASIRYTNGEEGIELRNGGRIEYSARSRRAARGFDGISLVVFDEAQELTDDQLEALLPTLSASDTGTRQLIFTGTPPYPGTPGEVFRRRRKICIDSPGQHDAWHEWSVTAKGIEDISLDDVSLWYMTNPALGVRLSEEFLSEERKSMKRDGFARECLCWWSPAVENRIDYAIPKAVWDACVSDDLKPKGKTAYGIKFTQDGAEVILCGAVIPQTGQARVSLIERKPTGLGVQWLADWLIERYSKASCVVIDGRNGADVLVDKIAPTWKAKGSVIRPTGKNITAAAGTISDMLNEKTVTWYRGQEALRDSAVNSIKRPISGGWGFGGDNSAPIEAAALALWGAKTAKRDPNKTMRIG